MPELTPEDIEKLRQFVDERGELLENFSCQIDAAFDVHFAKFAEEMERFGERFCRRVDTIVDEMGRRFDRVDVRLNAVGSRASMEVRQAISNRRPRTFYSASEYFDVWGSGRKQLGHYG